MKYSKKTVKKLKDLAKRFDEDKDILYTPITKTEELSLRDETILNNRK